MSNTGELVSRIYSNFRGVDFRGEEINLVRSPDSLNVWKDYKYTESIRTRPGLEWYTSSAHNKPIYGISFYHDTMIIHCGDALYKVVEGQKTILFSGLNEAVSDSFVFEDVLYIKDGKYYLCYDGTAVWDVVTETECYVPTTSIARKPSDAETPSGGTDHEDINMLQSRRINTFLADYVNRYFYLDALEIDTDFVPVVKSLDGQKLPKYTVDYEKGIIIFDTAPLAPLTDGQDNISVEFSKTIPEYTESILNSTLLQVFDNRVFFSGNKDYPNTVWHCSLNDPTYVSHTDYYNEGMDNASVTGMVAGNNALWVFREPSDANTNVFYHTPSVDDTYGKIYPSSHSSVTTGCIGKAINFNDDIVFFSERGMEGISGDITTEQVVEHRSSLVDRKLVPPADYKNPEEYMLARDKYKNMVLAEWEGYLLVFIGNKVFLADSRAVFTNEDHIEYEWFYWEIEQNVICARVHDGVLYLGTENGVYTMTDNDCAIESYWVTPKDKFKYPHMLKTTNKRGCVAEAEGDIAVYAKVEDTEFQLIGEYSDVKDYFVSRIKRKKFKDIQLKFHSKTRFSLETVTLEAWIGGYIKR